MPDKFDKIVRDKLEHFEADFETSQWDKMDDALTKEAESRKKVSRIWLFIAVFSLLFNAGMLVLIFGDNPGTKTKLATLTATEQQTIAKSDEHISLNDDRFQSIQRIEDIIKNSDQNKSASTQNSAGLIPSESFTQANGRLSTGLTKTSQMASGGDLEFLEKPNLSSQGGLYNVEQTELTQVQKEINSKLKSQRNSETGNREIVNDLNLRQHLEEKLELSNKKEITSVDEGVLDNLDDSEIVVDNTENEPALLFDKPENEPTLLVDKSKTFQIVEAENELSNDNSNVSKSDPLKADNNSIQSPSENVGKEDNTDDEKEAVKPSKENVKAPSKTKKSKNETPLGLSYGITYRMGSHPSATGLIGSGQSINGFLGSVMLRFGEVVALNSGLGIETGSWKEDFNSVRPTRLASGMETEELPRNQIGDELEYFNVSYTNFILPLELHFGKSINQKIGGPFLRAGLVARIMVERDFVFHYEPKVILIRRPAYDNSNDVSGKDMNAESSITLSSSFSAGWEKTFSQSRIIAGLCAGKGFGQTDFVKKPGAASFFLSWYYDINK